MSLLNEVKMAEDGINDDKDDQGSMVMMIVFGVLIIASVVTSSLLNPVLVACYYRKRPSLQRNLFLVLAMADLATTTPLAAVYGGYMMIDKESPEWIQVYHCIPGCISQTVTFLLALTRFYVVLRPLSQEISPYLVYGYLMTYSTGMTVNNILMADLPIPELTPDFLDKVPGLFKADAEFLEWLCWGFTLVQATLGLLGSVLTVTYLFYLPNIGQSSKKRDGAVTILLMNLPYLINIFFTMGAFWFNKIFELPGVDFGDLQFATVPILISGYNPLVILSRKESYRRYFLQLCRRCMFCFSSSSPQLPPHTGVQRNDTIITHDSALKNTEI